MVSETSQKSSQFHIHISVGLFSCMGFPGVSAVKKKFRNAGDIGSIPGSGRSLEKENPLRYSCLENIMDRAAWWATVHGVANK